MLDTTSKVISSNTRVRIAFYCLAGVTEAHLENLSPSKKERHEVQLLRQGVRRRLVNDHGAEEARQILQDPANAGMFTIPANRPVVIGKWKQPLSRFNVSEDFLEDFANSESSPNGALRFIKKYGPLRAKPEHGQEFSEYVSEWLSVQESLQRRWAGFSQGPERVPLALRVSEWFRVDTEEGFAWSHGELVFNAASLERVLFLTFYGQPLERYRVCANPDCKHLRFFIARNHLGQRFCSDGCAEWARGESKRRWWNEHGKSWRKQRRRRKKDQTKRRV